jgi:hypothetical protein
MAYFKNIPPRPNCIYCGKPVADEAWDEESHGWFSYGPNCMLSHPNGRFAVKMTEGDLSIVYSVKLTTMARAVSMADYLTRSNPQYKGKVRFEAVDLGKGIAHECKTNHH